MDNLEIFKNVSELVTLDKEQIELITKRLPEYFRVKSMIGHSTSQASYTLQTMNMISDSPMSRMKQCMAQVRKKYSALSEAYFSVEKKKLRINKLLKKENEFSELEARKLTSEIAEISVSMENTLREIGLMQDLYDSIKKKNKISDEWNEKDFEDQEIAHMIRSAFRICIHDLTAHGRVNAAATEYFEQLGIHPQYGEHLTRLYLVDTQKILNETKEITIQLMYDFLDEMVNKFKDSYKLALERMGIEELGSKRFMANNRNTLKP